MFAVLSGLLYVLGFIPYIVAIVRGQAVPSKATWIIWSVLDMIALAGMLFQGEISSTLIVGTIGSITVAVLSLIKGQGGWSKLDWFCLAGAVIGMALWAVTKQADLAIIITMVVTLVGAVPTLKSAWINPTAENKLAWALYASGCLCGLVAVSDWTIAGALQPVVFTLIDGTIAAVVFLRRN